MLANNGTRCVVHFILSVLKDTLHIIKGWTLVNLIKMYPLLAFTTQNTQISPRKGSAEIFSNALNWLFVCALFVH